ncbi:hypothetical protein BMF35_a1990 [Aurantiacibacter gangjinensis]|nr:hypothetical protein BMF35_a1990 [Aurantiacibacter gangjinensis]
MPSDEGLSGETVYNTDLSQSDDAYELQAEEEYHEAYDDEAPASPRATWLAPAFTILLALAWTGFFGWVNHQAMLAGAAPAQWVDWIVQWSVPMVLLIGLYLLVMRNSRREANRFTDAARALSTESAQLEARLLTVNRELALARDFIASQSNDLEALGRLATERLSTNADKLQSLIRDNTAQVEAIGHVSDNAVVNMETLREQLPVLTNAARDMSNQVGNAGNSAQRQIDELLAAFERLGALEAASEERVSGINEAISTTLGDFNSQINAIGDLTEQRFSHLRTTNEQFRSDLESSEERVFDAIAARSEALSQQLAKDAEAMREREAQAAAAMRERIVTLRLEGERLVSAIDGGQSDASKRWGDAITGLENRMKEVLEGVIKLDEAATENARKRLVALNEEAQRVDQRLASSMNTFEDDFAMRRERNREREAEAIETLEAQIAEFDARIAQRKEDHLVHIAALAEREEALAERLTTLDTDMAALGANAENASGRMSEAAQLLTDRLTQSRGTMEESDALLGKLTDDSVRLLELIRATAEHSQGDLAESVGTAETRLTGFAEKTSQLREDIADAEQRSANIVVQLASVHEKRGSTNEELAELEQRLGRLLEESEQIAHRTSNELTSGIEALTEASRNVLANLRTEQTGAVEEIARDICEQSREQIVRALRAEAEKAITELEDITMRSQRSGQDTAAMLRDQMDRVAELAGNLEQRVEHARERAEEQVDNDFSRRSALITEALNSTAIDISKVFENDIGDVEWANYLRGDRGIFTRRAVRLLDKQDARKISEIYSEDGEFRDVVNRYIHDFEAMLRGILSTRDGNAIAVTLLSSDMGKLYVALAQGIERLRN